MTTNVQPATSLKAAVDQIRGRHIAAVNAGDTEAAVGVFACLAGLDPRDGWLSWSLTLGAIGALIGLPAGVLAVGWRLVAARQAARQSGPPTAGEQGKPRRRRK